MAAPVRAAQSGLRSQIVTAGLWFFADDISVAGCSPVPD